MTHVERYHVRGWNGDQVEYVDEDGKWVEFTAHERVVDRLRSRLNAALAIPCAVMRRRSGAEGSRQSPSGDREIDDIAWRLRNATGDDLVLLALELASQAMDPANTSPAAAASPRQAAAASQEDGIPPEMSADGAQDLETILRKAVIILADRCERAENSRDFSRQWYAERFRRLEDLGKEHGVWPQMAAIMANGTASAMETPTYAHQINGALHRAERFGKELADERKKNANLELRCRRLTGLIDEILAGKGDESRLLGERLGFLESEVARLEAEGSRQAMRAALWHRSYRHMERERDRLLGRVTEDAASPDPHRADPTPSSSPDL